MFLTNLSEGQKEGFLDLCIEIMETKDIVKEAETVLVQKYCAEMEIPYRIDKKDSSIESVLENIKNVSKKSDLKKLTVELIALIYADDVIDEQEFALLMEIKRKFEFTSHEMEDLVFATRHLLLSLKQIGELMIY